MSFPSFRRRVNGPGVEPPAPRPPLTQDEAAELLDNDIAASTPPRSPDIQDYGTVQAWAQAQGLA